MRKSTKGEQKSKRSIACSKREKTQHLSVQNHPSIVLSSPRSSSNPSQSHKSIKTVSLRMIEKSLKVKIRHQKEMCMHKFKERVSMSRQCDKKLKSISLIPQRLAFGLKRVAWEKLQAPKRKQISKNQACTLLSNCLKRVEENHKKTVMMKLQMIYSSELKSNSRKLEVEIAQGQENKFSCDFVIALKSLDKGKIRDKDAFVKYSAETITPILTNQLSLLARKRTLKNCPSDSEIVTSTLKSHIQCLIQIYKQRNSTVESLKQTAQNNKQLIKKSQIHENSVKDIKKLNQDLMSQHEKLERIMTQAKETGFVGGFKSCKTHLSSLKRMLDQQTSICLKKYQIDGAYELRNTLATLLNYYIIKFEEGMEDKVPSASTPKNQTPEVFKKVTGRTQPTIQVDKLNRIILNCRNNHKLKQLKQEYFYEPSLDKIIDNYMALNSQLTGTQQKQQKTTNPTKSQTNIKNKAVTTSRNRTSQDNSEESELCSIISNLTQQIEKYTPRRTKKNIVKTHKSKSSVQELQQKIKQLVDTLHQMKLEKDKIQQAFETFKSKQKIDQKETTGTRSKSLAVKWSETEQLRTQISNKKTEIFELRNKLAQQKYKINRLQQRIKKLTAEMIKEPVPPNNPKIQQNLSSNSNELKKQYQRKLAQRDIEAQKLKKKIAKLLKHYSSKSNKMSKIKQQFRKFSEKIKHYSENVHHSPESMHEKVRNMRINSFASSPSAKDRHHSLKNVMKSLQNESISKQYVPDLNQKILDLVYNICVKASSTLNPEQQQEIYQNIQAISKQNIGDEVFKHLEGFTVMHLEKINNARYINNLDMISSRQMSKEVEKLNQVEKQHDTNEQHQNQQITAQRLQQPIQLIANNKQELVVNQKEEDKRRSIKQSIEYLSKNRKQLEVPSNYLVSYNSSKLNPNNYSASSGEMNDSLNKLAETPSKLNFEENQTLISNNQTPRKLYQIQGISKETQKTIRK